ncbi:HypC/HybG/HupF family hydrogenase formation chaperone [soil metagenome]
MCLGIPGQIVEIRDPEHHIAVAEVTGVRREVNVGLVVNEEGSVAVGDWVLIHVGFAMSKIDEEEAARSLEFLVELGSVFDEEIDQFRETEAS